jgi:Skp family chaperone for outer membrane proteins
MKKKVTTDVSEQAGCSAVGKKATTLSSPPTKQFEKNHAKRAGDKKTPIQKAPVGTKEDGMARKIQTCFRGYRCRKLLQELRKKRTEYDEMMEKLQREAYVQMVKLERQRAEAERMWKSEERQKQKEQAQRISRMLEAAFEGDTIVIKSILEEVRQLWREHSDGVITRHQYLLVQCTDANENSPISEAAAGGDIDTIRLLLSLEANPNTKGQYGRTPLYRAAFAGHHGAVKVLLEGGADPRLTADDGARPEQVLKYTPVKSVRSVYPCSGTKLLIRCYISLPNLSCIL